jgi:hypothetical protein
VLLSTTKEELLEEISFSFNLFIGGLEKGRGVKFK